MDGLSDSNVFALVQEIRVRYALMGWTEQQIYEYYGCLPATTKLILTNQIYPSVEFGKWLEHCRKEDIENDIFGDESVE